jgi:protein ImuA
MRNIIPLSSHRAPGCPPEKQAMSGFCDMFPATPEDAGSVGFLVASLTARAGPILWVRDRMTGAEAGRLYLPQRLGLRMLDVSLSRAVDVLQAMEDGLSSGALGAVVGEMWGEPKGLTFTATKRLALRSEAHGVPCWLIRHGAVANLSAARNRWRVASLPSAPNTDDPAAPGDPRWQVELFRSRTQPPGTWIARYDRAGDRLRFMPASDDSAQADMEQAERHAIP